MPQPLDPLLPESIREMWASLSTDVVWLHGRWIIYRQLFGTNEQRVELLNESAGTFSWILQDLLLHNVQLSLSKIGDPAGTQNKQNLTLRRLHITLKENGEFKVANKMEPLISVFESACEKVRHRRNKWIAHNDLLTKLSERATPLSGPSREEIEIALKSLRDAMNCVQLHYKESETAYEFFDMNNDGNHLLSALAKAKRYQELIEEGRIPRDDFRRNYPQGI